MADAWLARAWDGVLIDIARSAGDAALAIQQEGSLGVEAKADDSPVTRADLAAHEIITTRLAHATPTIPVLSEEGDPTAVDRAAWTRFWLVDPLDGTKEFIRGGTDWTVNIALVSNGEPVVGVVVAPAQGLTFYGQQARGAYRIDARGDRTSLARVNGDEAAQLRVVASRSHLNEATRAALAALPEHELVTAGSSLKICRVADGTADLYPRFGPTMEWDTAAAHAVLAAAGGCLTDPHGVPLQYNKDDLSNPHFIAAASPALLAQARSCLEVTP